MLLTKAKEKIDKEELDDYYTWASAVWVNSRGQPLDFDKHKYLVDIYKDQHPSIVYRKAAQMGLSERLISESVWVCDRLNKNTLYVFPTSSQLGDFVQARLEPVFNFSDYLSRITGVLSADEKRERDLDTKKKVGKVGLKQIRNAFLYLRGSQNQQQIISVDADMIVLDERDRFTQAHVPYIDKRLQHSSLRWRREASTPTFPGKGVDEAYLKSDQRVWMVKCKHCDLEQEIDFFRNVDFEKKRTICTACKKPINRLKAGQWVAQKPENKEIRGYHINGIYNPMRTIADLIDTYEEAREKGFSAMQQFYNQVLGLPYEAEGTTLLRTDLDEAISDYEVPFHVTECVAGADVGEKINVIVSKPMNGKNRYVWIGTVSDFFGPTDSVEFLMNKYNIRFLVIDANPETRKVKDLIEKFPGRVVGAYYPTRKFDVQNYYTFDEFKSEVYIDRTISIDYLISDIQTGKTELPKNAKYIKQFYDQMTSSVRVTEINPRNGQAVARWVEKSADHYLHTANYNRIALQRGTVGQALLESYRKEEDKKVFDPGSLAGWANLVRLKGERL